MLLEWYNEIMKKKRHEMVLTMCTKFIANTTKASPGVPSKLSHAFLIHVDHSVGTYRRGKPLICPKYPPSR
jgi:hypothetical protein